MLLFIAFICDALLGDNLIHVPVSTLPAIVRVSLPQVPLYAVHEPEDKRAGEHGHWVGLSYGIHLRDSGQDRGQMSCNAGAKGRGMSRVGPKQGQSR